MRRRVVAVYCPPSSPSGKSDLLPFFASDIPTLVAADFNAKHLSWECFNNSLRGNQLLGFSTGEDVEIIIPGEPARVSNTGVRSVLDLVLVRGCVKKLMASAFYK